MTLSKEEEKKKLGKVIRGYDLESYIRATFDKVVPSGADELRVDCFSPHGCNGSDTKAHLWINIEKRAWICYKCGYGDNKIQRGTANLVRFMADAENAPYLTVRKRLLAQALTVHDGDLLEMLEEAFDQLEEEPTEYVPKAIKLPKQFYPIYGSKSRVVGKFRAYATQRWFPEQAQQLYHMHFCISKVPQLEEKYQNTFLNRIIWPVFDQEGTCRSAVARDITNGKRPRYVNWPNTDIAHFFWPLGRWVAGEFYPSSMSERVVLTEGIPDAHAVRCLTPYLAFACFGKKVSEEQVDLLLRNRVREVVLAWDYEAKDKMMRAVDRLLPKFDRVLVFPFKNPAWESSDFSDALGSDLGSEVADEFRSAIDVQSNEYCSWAIQR